jgi:hypothetical protein
MNEYEATTVVVKSYEPELDIELDALAASNVEAVQLIGAKGFGAPHFATQALIHLAGPGGLVAVVVCSKLSSRSGRRKPSVVLTISWVRTLQLHSADSSASRSWICSIRSAPFLSGLSTAAASQP